MFPQASARTRSVYGTTCWRRESCAYLQQIHEVVNDLALDGPREVYGSIKPTAASHLLM